MNYRLDPEKVPQIYDDFGKKTPQEIEDYHIKGRMRAVARDVSSRYTVIQLLGEDRAHAEKEMEEIITIQLKGDGMEVKFFNLEETTVDQETMTAIQKRTDASIDLQTKKEEQKVAEIEEETKILRAKKEAERQKIEALGVKEANELLNQSLSNVLLEQQWIEKWDGKLPTVTGQDNIMMNIPTVSQ